MDNPNYFERTLGELRSIQEVEAFVQANRRLFGNSLLAQLKEDFQRISTTQINDLISIAFRVEQIAIRFMSDSESAVKYNRQAKSAFELAAKIFEQVADAQLIASQEVNRDLYLHSAVDYSLGEFQANATVIARKVLEKFEFGSDSHANVLNATFLLLKKSLGDIEDKLPVLLNNKPALDESLQGKFLQGEMDELGIVEEVAHIIALDALYYFSRYLRLGNNEDFDLARNKINESLTFFNTIRDADNHILIQLVDLLIRQMQFSSLWSQLGDINGFRKNPILNRYIRVLTTDKRKPIYELWASQVESLKNVLDNSSSFVLQMPTSAGKTRIAEIKILQTLAQGNKRTKCIYIAPFKSLVTQVEDTLNYYLSKVGYRVASALGSYESTDFEELLIEETDVLVVTPEKLDHLFRQNKDFFNQVKLIIVDEGHLIDNGIRGLRLEMLLSRLGRALFKNGLQILFVSAVVPNNDEIAIWLTEGTPNFIKSDWKPTRLRQGLFYWNMDWVGTIRFPEERIRLNTKIERRLIRGHYLKQPSKKLKHPIYYPESLYDISIELALFFRNASPTIIFTAVRTHVNSIAQKFFDRIVEERLKNPDFTLVDKDKSEPLNNLAKTIERRMGDDFPLAKYVREGFAFHHGLLPDDLRDAIENAFRSNDLNFLIATPTLAQGVNLPVHLMIVANLDRGEASPFLIRDFRNIAGRSGRALHETEGYVIFVQNTQEDFLDYQKYAYLRDDRMEKVESVLLSLYRELIRHKLGISLEEFLDGTDSLNLDQSDSEFSSSLNTAFQTQILAMLYEELINETDPETVRTIIDKSLFGVQWKADRKYYEPLVEYSQKQVRYLSAQLTSPKQKSAYYQSGFSIKSCLALEAEIRELAKNDLFSSIRKKDGKLDEEVLGKILKLIDIPEEVNNTYKNNEAIVQATITWIHFGEITELIERHKISDSLFEDPLKVSDLASRHFSNDAPWALNAISRILSYLSETEKLVVDSEINLLSGYVKYGVDTPVSAYLCGLGILDRSLVKLIADHYYKEVSPNILLPNLGDFREWLQDLTIDELRALLVEERFVSYAWGKLQKIRPDIRPIDILSEINNQEMFTYVVGMKYDNRLAHLSSITIDSQLSLMREPENIFDPYAVAVCTDSGKKLGYIRSDKAFSLSTMIIEGRDVICKIEKINPDTFSTNRRLLLKISIKGTA